MHRGVFLLMLLVGACANSFGQSATRANTTRDSYPRIVAKIHLTGQSTIPTTTILTPKKNGLYRISAYGVITARLNVCSGAWNLVLGWTDDAGAEQTPILEEPFILGEEGSSGLVGQDVSHVFVETRSGECR